MKIKCTQCNNEKLIKSSFPLTNDGDDGVYLSKDVEVYQCLQCGHYEFFNMTSVNEYLELRKKIEDCERDSFF